MTRRRIGIFGWGVVAPRSPDIDSFERNLAQGESWLTPFREFGPANFLVGQPTFDFERYRGWFEERFPTRRFAQLDEKMGPMVKHALGAFIQSLSQNPGLERFLQTLGMQCHVYVATGLGDITVTHRESLRYEAARRRWNAFWAAPERCQALREYLAADDHEEDVPPAPDDYAAGTEEWFEAKREWDAYWAARSNALAQYLREAAAIQSEAPATSAAKLNTVRHKLSRIQALNARWGCPVEPWAAVSPDLLWNIANVPAAQISMIGRIMGPAFAPVAACASFGVTLKLAMDAIQSGEATAVVVGATDPPPHPMFLSAFYRANVLAADGGLSAPLTALKGTHLAGGACVWVVGDAQVLMGHGFKPLGLEIVGVGASSDANHIITPSTQGPRLAVNAALAGRKLEEFCTWDLHATATPGDVTELEHAVEMLPPGVVFSARKGTFGHGMSVAGGWELTAQHLAMAKGRLYPVSLREHELHPDIRRHAADFVLSEERDAGVGLAGKMSMGVGGINACVVSQPWEQEYVQRHLGSSYPLFDRQRSA